FLREVTRALTLTDVNIQNARAESLHPGSYDTVTLRAVERFESIPHRRRPGRPRRPPGSVDQLRPTIRREFGSSQPRMVRPRPSPPIPVPHPFDGPSSYGDLSSGQNQARY